MKKPNKDVIVYGILAILFVGQMFIFWILIQHEKSIFMHFDAAVQHSTLNTNRLDALDKKLGIEYDKESERY